LSEAPGDPTAQATPSQSTATMNFIGVSLAMAMSVSLAA
jgi:hypothetical protein